LADYCVTEAGFGADLGAEKFFDIKCRMAGLSPAAVVLVATARALKYNGGVPKGELGAENLAALEKGAANLGKHIENMRKYGLPVVVAINRFPNDTPAELSFIECYCRENGAEFSVSEVYERGGEGGTDLAEKVCRAVERPSRFQLLYPLELPLEEKIARIAAEIYGARGVSYTAAAQKSLEEIRKLGGDRLPVCIAKTQYSLSDDASLLGRPAGFDITIRGLSLSNGAGFVVAYAGNILTMPGLPKQPAAQNIDVDENGVISGLF
jgi:formate--tetrahydrofolate ligase